MKTEKLAKNGMHRLLAYVHAEILVIPYIVYDEAMELVAFY